VPDLLEERLVNTGELVASVAHVADPALTAEAYLLRGRAAVEAGDIEEADRCYAIADQLSAGLGQPALRWRVEYILVARALLAGRLPEAERLLVDRHDLGHAAGQVDADWAFAIQLWALRVQQGGVDDETIALLEASQQTVDVALNPSMLAVAACELGRDDQARAGLDSLASTPVPLDIYWLFAMTGWAAVAAHLDDAASAQAIEAALRPYAGQAVPFVVLPTPSVAHHLGLLATTLGRYEEADQHFHDALAIHERIGAPHFVARTRLERASMLLRRRAPGDDEHAQTLLGQALSTARELGLLTVERRAAALLSN
jgi:tetratricopeptide (TPR) repeat protein